MDYRELQQMNSTTVPASDTLPGLPRQADSESGCQQPPILPFIGRILEHRPRQSMRAERWLDVNEDRHLADHVFVDALAVKPVSSCLPVIPMTLCMEMMAEAAACLAPGYGLIGFENLRAVRWIQMTDTDRLRIELSASVTEIDQAQEFCRIAVTLRSEDQSNSACEASVLFASRYRLSVVPRFTGLTNAAVHPLPAERFYQERYLFHGPSYHALTGSIVLGDQGAAGHLIVKSPAGFFRSTQSPQFLTDPALLDAVGQLIGIWAMERERYAFPIGLEKLEIYRPAPLPGTVLPVLVEVIRDEGKTIACDVEIQDGEGAVWIRIREWKEWKFRWNKRLVEFRRQPTLTLLSELLGLPGDGAAMVCAISDGDVSGTDANLLARYYLHVEEMDAFRRREQHPREQLSWLQSRIAAKDAVRSWLAARAGSRDIMMHPAALLLSDGEAGWMSVASAESRDCDFPCVSVSQTDGWAVALAAGRRASIEAAPASQRESSPPALTVRERRLLATLEDQFANRQDEWALRLTCAKRIAGRIAGDDLNIPSPAWDLYEVTSEGAMTMHKPANQQFVHVLTYSNRELAIAYAWSVDTKKQTSEGLHHPVWR